MRRRNLELWAALATMLVLSAVYTWITQTRGIPESSGWGGHLIGVAGFIMMLMTEFLYSLRKRYTLSRWGRLQSWLSFHVYTGLLGPFLVLLHSGWNYRGLAGIVMGLTIMIVISGFIGRYFYTQVPKGVDEDLPEVPAGDNKARRYLAIWHTFHVPLGVTTFTLAFIHIGAALYYATLAR